MQHQSDNGFDWKGEQILGFGQPLREHPEIMYAG